ncbi:MAG: branched-chain amino acid ABC transporter permease [Erysipelothrix sp.]|jgi:branched-chain amino acid transport system permease protein|nr:branched-chain amino acid ABC transporter permease [Erysipelothrix sp.]
MVQFIQQFINGMSLGSIYALVALGYTMVYGIIKLINFAHGEMYMIGAFFSFYLITILKLPFFVALFISMALVAVLGFFIERIAYKPLRNATRIAALITAIGVSFLMQYTTMFLVGADTKVFPEVFVNKNYYLFSIKISFEQILIFVITAGLMIALQALVNKTRIGRSMRAVSTDKEAAALMGIDVDKTIAITFALGAALAAAAGTLVGMYYNTISPLMGVNPGLKAFVAAVFGGIGHIRGAMLGGFVIGLIETMVIGAGYSLMKDAIVFFVLILVLIIKPSGLLGKGGREKV